ncbi:MAG TPA: DUF3618 domain-containing protein, partial [Micromonosporaceae bacterium]
MTVQPADRPDGAGPAKSETSAGRPGLPAREHGADAAAVFGVVEHRVDAVVLRRRIEAERLQLGHTVAEIATRLDVKRQLRER